MSKKILLSLVLLQASFLHAQLWHTFEGGVNGAPAALIIYNGNLMVSDVANGVLQWNGSNWSSLGKGVNGSVNSFAIYNGYLIVGGSFDSAGGVAAKNIAKWNGTSWSSIGQGISGSHSKIMSTSVNAICVYNDSLFAAGYFDTAGGKPARNIAEWNGSSWTALGRGVDSTVYALAVYDSNVVAGGQFDSAGAVYSNVIAQWNGSVWSVIGLGGNVIEALTVFNGNLIAGGYIPYFNDVAQWNGSTWSGLGTGTSISDNVAAFTTYAGSLIAGGMFHYAGGIYVHNVAQWNGSNWDSLGPGLDGGPGPVGVEALVVYNGVLIASGQIELPDSNNFIGIAKWGGVLTGINALSNKNSTSVYPNPSNGVFTIQSSVNSSQLSVKIYNVTGEVVYNAPLPQSNKEAFNVIDLTDEPNGVYLYRLISEKGEVIGSGKLVIER